MSKVVHVHRAYMIGEISEEPVADLMRELDEVDAKYPEAEIELIINSQGGSIIEGMALYSTLTELSLRGGGHHRVVTKVRGMAGSMATIVLQAGDWRVSGKVDITVWHEARMSFDQGYVSEIRQELDAWTRQDAMLEGIVQERSGLSDAEVRELHQPCDRILMASEALAYNLIDEVV